MTLPSPWFGMALEIAEKQGKNILKHVYTYHIYIYIYVYTSVESFPLKIASSGPS